MKLLISLVVGLLIGYGANADFVSASDCGNGDIYSPGGQIIQRGDGGQDYCFSGGGYNYCQDNTGVQQNGK